MKTIKNKYKVETLFDAFMLLHILFAWIVWFYLMHDWFDLILKQERKRSVFFKKRKGFLSVLTPPSLRPSPAPHIVYVGHQHPGPTSRARPPSPSLPLPVTSGARGWVPPIKGEVIPNLPPESHVDSATALESVLCASQRSPVSINRTLQPPHAP